MLHINQTKLTKKAQKEIDDFFKVERFSTKVLAQKTGRTWELIFCPSDDFELFKRQHTNLDAYRIVDLDRDSYEREV